MDLKKQIILYMEELEHIPETSFEKDVVCEDEDSFCLSRENITSLKLLICQVRRFFITLTLKGDLLMLFSVLQSNMYNKSLLSP